MNAALWTNPIKTTKGITVVAHRGACGYLPEHTAEAKAMARAMDPHFIEQDIPITKDNRALVIHDHHLHTVSNVAEMYPQRKRKDGKYYVIDFTAMTLEEEIELIQGLNKSRGTDIGIYTELKSPRFHTREGKNIGKIVLGRLTGSLLIFLTEQFIFLKNEISPERQKSWIWIYSHFGHVLKADKKRERILVLRGWQATADSFKIDIDEKIPVNPV